ncbi:hypothetical protein LTR60_002300 [Cryomyces antarcticus]|nr:hypothetical protein LTR60_002300 [Cryomyces antarcticus]
MTDAQQLVDYAIKNYNDLSDSVERHFESVAASLRDAWSTSTWLPEAARPLPPPRPAPVAIPLSYLGKAQDWISRNRALTAAIVAFVGTGAVLVYRMRKIHGRKRRARRASNGARREIVVVAGTPNSPIAKSLSLDLERRGFIVYVVVSTAEEEQIVKDESRVDIRPLHLDIVDPLSAQDQIDYFNRLLRNPHQAFAGASPHNLNLAGLVLVPDLTYPSGPVETISPEVWSDTLNVKVLNTIATAQAFVRTVCDFKARVLILTPNIISSLRPPFHGVESAVVGALEAFTTSLRGELGTLGIDVCHFKLGSFDLGGVGGKHHLQTLDATRTADWPANVRTLYATNFVAQSRKFGGDGKVKGSPLGELHNSVFDALTQKRPRRVWRVGRGSLVYDVVGAWVPARIVGWMLGIRRVQGEEQLHEVSSEEGTQSMQWEKIERAV